MPISVRVVCRECGRPLTAPVPAEESRESLIVRLTSYLRVEQLDQAMAAHQCLPPSVGDGGPYVITASGARIPLATTGDPFALRRARVDLADYRRRRRG